MSALEGLDFKRQASGAQGALLVALSLVSVAATALLVPIMPKLIADFAPFDPAAEQKAIIALSIPALVVGIISPFIGKMTDTFGRKRLLVAALFFYGLVGVAPAFMHDLNLIIMSRIAIGIMEAMIMVSSTTMIGDYFHGETRERWLAGQAGAASLGAVIFFGLGGAMGDGSWRNTFMLFAASLVAAVAAVWLLHEPRKTVREEQISVLKFPWHKMRGLYALSFFGAILFFVPQIQVPFLLGEHGITSSQTIGLVTAAGALAVPVGSIIFKLRSKASYWSNLVLAFALMTVGILLMSRNLGVPFFVGAVVLANLGCGIFLPQMITGIMAHLHFDLRGRGTSGWQLAFFLGNFVSPLIILALAALLGRTSLAVASMAGVSALIVIVLLVLRPLNEVDATTSIAAATPSANG